MSKISFTIIHEHYSAYESSSRATWAPMGKHTEIQRNQFRIPFNLTVDRPDAGIKTFSMKCPHCEEELKVKVLSQDLMFALRKSNKRFAIYCWISCPVFLVTGILLYGKGPYYTALGIILALLSLAISTGFLGNASDKKVSGYDFIYGIDINEPRPPDKSSPSKGHRLEEVKEY